MPYSKNPIRTVLFVFLIYLIHVNTGSAKDIHENLIKYDFERITFKEGLPNLRVDCILQDYMGYLWFVTKRGLCKYNGYEFEVFKSNSSDTTSLVYHQISCLLEDRDSILWIGTWNGGLHKYNRKLNNFERFPRTDKNITELFQDSDGFIWVGTENGLFRYDKKRDVTSSYQFTAEDGYSPLQVSCIIEDGKELLVSINKVGFNTPSNFTASFKAYYGISPKNYKSS